MKKAALCHVKRLSYYKNLKKNFKKSTIYQTPARLPKTPMKILHHISEKPQGTSLLKLSLAQIKPNSFIEIIANDGTTFELRQIQATDFSGGQEGVDGAIYIKKTRSIGGHPHIEILKPNTPERTQLIITKSTYKQAVDFIGSLKEDLKIGEPLNLSGKAHLQTAPITSIEAWNIIPQKSEASKEVSDITRKIRTLLHLK